MGKVFVAFGKAARDLARPGILWQAVWPVLLAVALWVFVATLVWAYGVSVIAGLLPELPWSSWAFLTHWAAVFLMLALLASLVYATSLLLVSLFSLPRMLALVAARDYPDVVAHGESPFVGSLVNTLVAGAIFLAGWLLTLPLLLIPGVVLVMPLAWTAWLNQRVFRFDALVEHATRSELRAIVAAERPQFYLAGIGSALAAHIPLANLLAPAFAALAYVHLCLAALRRLRQERGVEL